MKTKGQKNTVEITAGELAKLPPAAKVAVSVGWLRDYNRFAGQMGLPAIAEEGEVTEVSGETSGGGTGNIQVG